MSDAVRLMEEPPRLLDEINALDFNRLPDWESLCERNGWQKPPPFDRTLLEKVLMLSESTEVAEPFLRMYRKAVRTNNNALAVRALRRLAEVDHSQDWESNLVQAETTLQRQLGEAFAVAQASGDEEEMDRIAREILETRWRNMPQGKVARDVRTYWEDKESRRRDAEGTENLSLLRRCRDENWNRALAFSLLQAIDILTENGWQVPPNDCELMNECRRRVAEEMEAEDRNKSWKACCEVLHGAIQREDTVAIREAMAAPDFLDREPPEELLRDAQRVIEHEEAAKRRKVMQIAVCSLLALVAVLGVSGWWLRQKLFSMRCDGEAAKLATLEKGAHAIDHMGEALRQLEANDPEVYADPRVNVYVGKRKTMIEKNLARTNEVVSLLAELSTLSNARWTNATDAVTGQLARVEALLTGDDVAYRTKWLKLKTSYEDQLAAAEEVRREKGTKRHETLTTRMRDLAARLSETIGGEEQDKTIACCRADVTEWREDYGSLLPEIEGKLTTYEKELADAEQKQKNVREALAKLRAAQTAPDILEKRKNLIEFYSGYPAVKRLAPNPVEATTAHEVLDGTTVGQKAFAAVGNAGIPPDAFKSFLDENVASLKEIPAYYSLYGLMVSGDRTGKFFAASKGKADFKKPSYADAWLIEGEMLDLYARKMTDKIEKKVSGVKEFTIPSVDEIKEWVDIASRGNMTLGQFENEVLKQIERHLREVNEVKNGKKPYLEAERRCANWDTLTRDRYTAWRRVIMLDIYFKWLKEELKLMPPDNKLTGWVEKVETLAQPVHVDGVPEDLSWVCLWERRVRDRNMECVRLLEKIPADWTAQYREWRAARSVMREIVGWKVETAGQLLFDPRNPWQQKNPDAIIPIVLQTVKQDHPLYVLRTGPDGRLHMRKALVPSGGKWAMIAGAGHLPGEPLYQICRDGKPIDARKEIEERLKAFPERIVKVFSAKIPFFDMEEKK
ncbi:MAG: hypothetical protein IKO72_08100 [Kiritimatiellae bacterium]|nr:hypothetical protein [Kiritimatiellia bacterium]